MIDNTKQISTGQTTVNSPPTKFNLLELHTDVHCSILKVACATWKTVTQEGEQKKTLLVNTWAHVDMEFLFECSTRYLTRSLCSIVRYKVEHEKRNSISNHTSLFCLLYGHTKNEVFDDFPTAFQRFPKILQKLSEGHTNVSKGRTKELLIIHQQI